MINNALKKVIFLLFFGVIIFMVSNFILPQFISLQMIKQHRLYLSSLIDSHYTLAILCYIALYIIFVALSLPLVAALTITGGYFFGAIPATIYTNIGATIGAVIAFLIFRYFIGQSIQDKYKTQLDAFNKSMESDGNYYLLSIHFIAAIPFFMVNILASLTKVSLWDFIWTTSLGILPVSLVFAYAGKQLSTLESVRDIFSLKLILAFALLTVIALLPVILKKIKK